MHVEVFARYLTMGKDFYLNEQEVNKIGNHKRS